MEVWTIESQLECYVSLMLASWRMHQNCSTNTSISGLHGIRSAVKVSTVTQSISSIKSFLPPRPRTTELSFLSTRYFYDRWSKRNGMTQPTQTVFQTWKTWIIYVTIGLSGGSPQKASVISPGQSRMFLADVLYWFREYHLIGSFVTVKIIAFSDINE